MTAGEFMRKLKERILEEGYTSNNLIITDIEIKENSIKVSLVDTKDNAVEIYLDEN